MTAETLRKTILRLLYFGPKAPRRLELEARENDQAGTFDEVCRMRREGLLEVNDDLKLQITQKGRELVPEGLRQPPGPLPTRALTPGEQAILEVIYLRCEQGVTCEGLCSSISAPGLTGDPDYTSAQLRSLQDLGLIMDVCPQGSLFPIYHLTTTGRALMEHGGSESQGPTLGIDMASGPDKMVCALMKHDPRALGFVVHEVFEVARWEETETHLYGFAPDGTPVVSACKAAIMHLDVSGFVVAQTGLLKG